MIVKELIEELKKLDPELEIWIDNDGRLEKAISTQVQKNDLYYNPYDVVLVR